MAWPANAVADGLALDEVGRLERAKLLEDASPARTDRHCELVRRRGALTSEPDEDLAAQGSGRAGASGRRRRRGRDGGGVVGSRVHRPNGSTGVRRVPRGSGATLGAMDLDLSSEHQLLRTTVRDFMENEVAGAI